MRTPNRASAILELALSFATLYLVVDMATHGELSRRIALAVRLYREPEPKAKESEEPLGVANEAERVLRETSE